MARRRRERATLLVLVAGAALFVTGQVLAAADDTVRTAASCTPSCRYSPEPAAPSIPAGGSLDFQNHTAGTSHNVTATKAFGGKPLFGSGSFTGTAGGVTRAVKGVQYLAPGSYNFICTIHPTSMKGTLTVAGGSPVPRPDIGVAILSRKLGAVRRSGELKVKVQASTKSDNVALNAKKGSKTLARTSNIDLGADDSQRLAMRLTRKGKRALKGLDRARVKLTGTVPFGKPDSATRTLH
jgi:plastocyanin